MAVLLMWLALFLTTWLLTSLFLWLGGRWLKASRVTLLRASALTLPLFAINVLSAILVTAFGSALAKEQPLAVSIVAMVITTAANALVIGWFMRTTFVRAMGVWGISLIPGALACAFAFLVMEPFVSASYTLASASMAPTLIGPHKTARCPVCGGTAFSSTPFDNGVDPEFVDGLGICSQCRNTSKIKQWGPVESPDRFVMDRLATPQRWDLVVFRHPTIPLTRYVKRVVGLPGEVVFIKDGAVWVNGSKIPMPEAVPGLHYTTIVGNWDSPIDFGSEERPWKLQQDEFCVLGDFSARSSDSRDWGPLPGSHIEGVARWRYWPISRWGWLR